MKSATIMVAHTHRQESPDQHMTKSFIETLTLWDSINIGNNSNNC